MIPQNPRILKFCGLYLGSHGILNLQIVSSIRETDSFLNTAIIVLEMSLTVAHVYSVRFSPKLPLPDSVQDNIAKLRITAASYKPLKYQPKFHSKSHTKYESTPENWRIKSLVGYVSKIKNKDDPDYSKIFEILNKVSPSNIDKLSQEAIEILKTRDHEFRLRISALLFDKAINESMFANVMSDFALKLNNVTSEVRDDLILQANMFPKLYDINITLTYPSSSEPDYTEKVIQWMKQKDKRRGYARFLTQLYIRNLVTDDIMKTALEQVVSEMNAMAKMSKTEQTEENTTQFVDFIFESSKLLPKDSCVRGLIRDALTAVLSISRSDVPSLGMRSRFRLEDALKCVQ